MITRLLVRALALLKYHRVLRILREGPLLDRQLRDARYSVPRVVCRLLLHLCLVLFIMRRQNYIVLGLLLGVGL